MRVGLFHTIQWPEGTSQRDRYREFLEQALYVAEHGFDSIWLTEHHFSRHGIISDSLNVLSHLAARTESVRLGTAVSVLPLHNPVSLAERVGIVDQLSGGRLEFGTGKGYQVGEFAGLGVNMADREDRFAESMDILQRSWMSEEPFTYEGKYFSGRGIFPQPKPVQKPHPPIWVATDTDSGFRKCAENDWGILLPQGRSIQAVKEQLDRYRAALDAANRPYTSDRVILARVLYLAANDETAWEEAARPYGDFLSLAERLAGPGGSPSQRGRNPFALNGGLEDAALFGSPDTCIERIHALENIGITRAIMFVHIGGLGHDQIMGSLRLFCTEVLPMIGA